MSEQDMKRYIIRSSRGRYYGGSSYWSDEIKNAKLYRLGPARNAIQLFASHAWNLQREKMNDPPEEGVDYDILECNIIIVGKAIPKKKKKTMVGIV